MRTTNRLVSSCEPESFLSRMRCAHERLGEQITELERLTLASLPLKEDFVRARLSISQASLNRRILWSEIYTRLHRKLSADDEASLRGLQHTEEALVRSSSAHLARWTTDAALADWSGYCAASKDMRWKMKAAMVAEKRILYPILRRTS